MTLARQYLAKLTTNIVVLLAGLVTLTLVPRTLGPEAFGRYEFLTNFFLQLKGFLDMGTSSCFYARLSQRQGDTGLVTFYRRFLFVASALIIGGTLLFADTSVGYWLWVGEDARLIVLAACCAVIVWWLDTTRKMVDAWNLTVRGEKLYAYSRLAATLMLVVMVWAWGLQLEEYFAYQIVTSLLTLAVLTHLLIKRPRTTQAILTPQPTRAYMQEFWSYSHPLIVSAAAGVLIGLADRWILQTQAGTIEQGFFGLAFQVSAVCFMFTSAMTQILTREFAVAWDQQNMERMRFMFRRIVPLLYAVAAYFSVFTSYHSEDVIWLLGGHAWENGALAMSIMALYPMHQTYGQLSGSVFYASGQTRLYRNINIGGMLAGLPVMLWLVMPVTSGGLGLGAVGLALKMVILLPIVVNVQLWFNARLLSLNFWKFLAHQLFVPVTFLLCALASSELVSLLNLPRIGQFLLAGICYSSFVAMMIMLIPQLVGLQKGEVGNFLRKTLGRIK
ncbi:MAG: lipopolysaccharide biosynthesis protein [Gallionella sp.]|nr:lipopolysaccharide biosynthesis protein [Gallionella sp.]